MTKKNETALTFYDRAGDLDYINSRYGLSVEKGTRVTFEHEPADGTIVGSHPSANHYLWVLLDGDAEPVILHPTWKVRVHA